MAIHNLIRFSSLSCKGLCVLDRAQSLRWCNEGCVRGRLLHQRWQRVSRPAKQENMGSIAMEEQSSCLSAETGECQRWASEPTGWFGGCGREEIGDAIHRGLRLIKNTSNRCCIPEAHRPASVLVRMPLLIDAADTSWLCADISRGDLTQILSSEPLRRGKLPSSCLCSSHPTTFIISSSLRSLRSSIIPASSFALLVFGTDLTTALQCGQRCITCFSSFLSTCKVFNPKASPFTVHAPSNVFLFSSYTRECSPVVNIWDSAETGNMPCRSQIGFALRLV